MKNQQAEVAWSDEDLAYVAWAPGAPGCRGLGESPAKALESLQAALAEGEDVPPVPEGAPAAAQEAPAEKRPEKSVVRLTRLEAASRQLDAAIRLFFDGGDPLAVQALVTAAGELFADRAARWGGGESRPDDSLPRETYLRTLHRARELLRTPGGEEPLEFDGGRNESLIAQAIADRLAACPSRALSREMAAYREWYGATRAPSLEALPAGAARSRRRNPNPLSEPPPLQFSLLPDSVRH